MKSLFSSSVVAFAVFMVGCGLESSVVGGRCADGMVLSGNRCVSTGSPDTTLGAPTEAPAPSPGATSPASGQVEAHVDAPAASTPLDDGAIVLPSGAPPFPLPPPPPLVCAAPLVACYGDCIPVANDPRNCGACNKICPSNICVDGECQGKMPGDVVLIGHDYTNAVEASSQAKVLVNALTIPTTEPIRVLSYEDGATAAAVAQAKVVAAAGLLGRTIAFVRAEGSPDLALPSLSKSYDVVMIHGAKGTDPITVGASWSASLGEFASKGGVVVAIDDGSSPMPELLSSAGLLALSSHAMLPEGTHMVVTSAQDTVGVQVLSPYASFGASVGFQGIGAANADLSWVVRAKDGGGGLADPVVVHRIVR